MLNYTNKTEREPQERSSNIELLRILSMFLVLMIHYIPSRTLPTHDTLAHDTLGTLFDLELRSISFVCVNCFILISGYFGIRWKLKSFSNLLFQILFWYNPQIQISEKSQTKRIEIADSRKTKRPKIDKRTTHNKRHSNAIITL